MSKEKIRKIVINNQKKLLSIFTMLIAILVIVGINVYANKSYNYVVEIKDSGEQNIARNNDYDENIHKVYDSSITKKIIEDTPNSLTYEVQIKNLAQTKANAQIAIVIDSSMSMKNNDEDNENYNLIEKVKEFVTQLREDSSNTKISISSNNKLEIAMSRYGLNNYLTAIDNIEFTYGEELGTAIDYGASSFINNNEEKYLIIFSDATDKAKDKLESLILNDGVEVISVLSDITNNEYKDNTDIGTAYMISDIEDFSNIVYKTTNSISNVKITDIFSNEVNEYFDFIEVEKDSNLEMEEISNGYILKCNQIKAGAVKTYKFTLKLKENANIDSAKTYRELETSDNLKVEYTDINLQNHTYEMEKSPTYVICNKYSLTIKAVSEKSDSVPIEEMKIKVIGTTVVGQDENGNDIIETIFDETLETDEKGRILIDNLKTLGDIKFEIKPIVNQFGYQETGATTVIVHNDPKGVGTIWAESDNRAPEIDVIERNITVILPILVETYTMEVETVDLADANIKLGNIEYRLIQPKLNSKYEMEALYGVSGENGKLIFKPAVMTKDGSYQYVLTQMSEQEGYDSMGVVILIVTFENGKVTKIDHIYNEDVETELINAAKTKVIVGNSPLKEDTFNLNINLSDEYSGEKLFGAIYDILVTRTTTAGDQVQTLLSSYITDDNGQINVTIPGTGYVNLKITQVSPRAGYIADKTVKEITFLRRNGTVQYISNKTPVELEAIADTDNNIVIVNLKSKLASEQNRIQVHLVDENEKDVNIGRVALAINKVGSTEKIYSETNREGIANFILPNESIGTYQYEISLVSGVPEGYIAPTIQQLGVITVQYGTNKYIVSTSKISQTVPTLNVSFEQEHEEEIIYDTAKVELSLEVDPTYSYNFKISLLDESTNKGLANGKYSILMEADGEEVKYLSRKLTDANGKYTTRIVGGGRNATIKVTQTETVAGYIKNNETQEIELERTEEGYKIINSTPNVYDPENNQYIGAEKVENNIIYHDINKCKTGANTILNLYVNKVDTNECLVEGIKVKLSSETLLKADGKKLDELYDILDEAGNVIEQRDYYITDENGYFEQLAIKVKGDELNNGERIDYIEVHEIDDEGNIIPNTNITLKLTFRLNKETGVVEVTNVEATWGNRLVKSKTFSSRETDIAYENDVYLDIFTNYDDVGNFSIDLQKVNKNKEKLPGAKYDIIVIRPDGTKLVRKNVNITDNVELEGILVSAGTKIEITEKEAPIGYNINNYTEVITITSANEGVVTCKLEESGYSEPRAEIISTEPIVTSDGSYKLNVKLQLIDYEADTFKIGIKAQDAKFLSPVRGCVFSVSTSEGAQKNIGSTGEDGKANGTIGANYKIDDYVVTYTINTLQVADYYKKLVNPIESKIVFDLNGNIKAKETIEANKEQAGFGEIWNIIQANTIDGNDIDIVVNIDTCDPLVVNIQTQDTLSKNELTDFKYKITPSINIKAEGTTRIEVGYVIPNGIQTYTIKQTNANEIKNYMEIPEQKIKLTYDEEGNVIALEEQTNQVHKVSINEKEISIIIDAEPKVPFTMKNIAYFNNETNIPNAKLEISVADDETTRIVTNSMGEEEFKLGKFETNTSKTYTVKQIEAGTGYAKVDDFQIKVDFDKNSNIINAELLGAANDYIDFISLGITRPSSQSDKGYNGNDRGIINITVKSYPEVEFNIENVDRRDDTIKLQGTKYKVESRIVGLEDIYTMDENITTGNNGIGTAKLDKSGYDRHVIYTITEISPSARYQTMGIEAIIDAEFNESGYIIGHQITKRSDILEVTAPEIVTVEDNFKLNLKIKSNPELKINITKVDEDDVNIVIPKVDFEITSRIIKSNLTEEEQQKLTIKTGEQEEEYYLGVVLDRLKIVKEEIEDLRKNIALTNIIKELKDNNKLSEEEEQELENMLNDTLKINKLIELNKLKKSEINKRIQSVTNKELIDKLIEQNKTTTVTVEDLLNTVKEQVRLDVDRVVTDKDGIAISYIDKTLANKTIEYTIKETKKVDGYDWLDEIVILEITYDANGMMLKEDPVKIVSGNIDITQINQYDFSLKATIKNAPSKEFRIHLSVEDVYDSNKKLEVAKYDTYLTESEFAPDNDYRVNLETGSMTTGTTLSTAHGEDTESFGVYTKGAGTRILRLVEKEVPTAYYLGNDKFESMYQSIKYALLVKIGFDDEGKITDASIYNPGGDTNRIGYIADERYMQVSHTRNTVNVTVRYYPMLQVQIQAKDKYTNESLTGKYTIDTTLWGEYNGPSEIVSAGYINPHFRAVSYDDNYSYEYFGTTYKTSYITENTISSVEEAKRVAVAPTEADSFEQNKNTNKDRRTRRLYVYENTEPNAPVQYQTYLPRHITDSKQYLLAIIDVEYDDLGQIKTVNVIQEKSQTNIKEGFFKTIKADVNEHTIKITIDYAPITTINATVIDEISRAPLSGIRINPYLGKTDITSTSYEYRTTLYYTTNEQGTTGWTYWGASIPDTLTRYELDSYTVGTGYSGYLDPENIILDVSYDEKGRVSSVTPKSTDNYGDINAIDISWENNNIQITIKYSRAFKVKLNKVDYNDANTILNATFNAISSKGANESVAANVSTVIGKVYAGKTVEYTISETRVPVGYIPIENFKILVEFKNDGTIKNATSTSNYYEFIKAAPVDSKINSIRKVDLEANIKNKPRFDINIELSDEFYENLKLSGATFTIENNKGDVASGGVKTDVNGIMQTYVGTVYKNEEVTYTVKQTNVIAGYYENNTISEFKVKFNDNGKIENYSLITGEAVTTIDPVKHIGTKAINLNITNKPKDLKIGIYKYDELTKNVLENVKFKVTVKEKEKLDIEKEDIVTKANGTAVDIIGDFKPTTGENRIVTYVISEIESATSYRKIQPIEIKVTFKPDGSIYLYDVISNPSGAKVELATNNQIKYVDKTPVHIKLEISNDNAYDLIVKNEDKNYEGLGIAGTKYDVTINGVVQSPITTDKEGIAKITNQTQNGEITIGISESKIGEGYREDNNNTTTLKIQKGEKEYSLKCTSNSNETYAIVEVDEEHGTITVTFKNETKLELTMQKNDINTGAVLQGAEFEIKEEELDNEGNVIEETQNIITTNENNTTDADGLLYFDLGTSKQNKTIRYTFTETKEPTGYTKIQPITVTAKFNSFGDITQIKDDSFRANETLSSKAHHMIVTIGNGTVNEAYTVKIVTEDSDSGRRINGSIFQVEAIETDTGATNKSITGATTNVSSVLKGNTHIFEKGALKVNGITAQGDVEIKFRQIESAVGYVYGENPTSGTVKIHTDFEIIPSSQEKQVTITEVEGNDERFDVQVDNDNRLITIKVLNDPQVNFEITKIDAISGTPIKGINFNITSKVVEDGEEIQTDLNTNFVSTNESGYTQSEVSIPHAGKTVIYTLKEEKHILYDKLEDIVIAVSYNINGDISRYKILSNPNDVRIKEDNTKTITKRVLSDSSPIIGIVDINYSSVTIPTGIGSRILQLEIKNYKKPNDYKIQLQKHHEDETYPYLLSGAKYEITVSQENGKALTTWVDITNAEGIITSEFFDGYGDIEIIVKELEAPEGFRLDDEPKVTKIRRDKISGEIFIAEQNDLKAKVSEDNSVITLNVVDKLVSGIYDVVINKVDSLNGNLIKENPANIKLEMKEEYSVVTESMDEETGEITENITTSTVREEIANEETDEQGRIILHNLKAPNEPGTYTYYLSELKAPKGYNKIQEDEVEIEITFEKNEYEEIIITNAIVKNAQDVRIGKTSDQVLNIIVDNVKQNTPIDPWNPDDPDDDDGSIKLAEDEFGIDLRKVDTTLEQITTTEAKFILRDLDKNTDTEIITDELGRAEVVKLKMPEVAGTYKYMLKEEEAPKGYKKIEDPMYILLRFEKNEEDKMYIETIAVKGNNILHVNKAETGKLPNKLIKLQVINEDLPYTLKIEKHHEADPDYPKFIEGVVFDIKITQEYGNETVIRKTETTNQDGIIEINGIEGYGRIKVEIQEISAPEQYKQDFTVKYLEFYRDKGSKELRQYDSNVGYKLKENEVTLMPVNELKGGLYDIVINKVNKENNTLITNNPASFSLYMIRQYHNIDENGTEKITEIREQIIQNEQTDNVGMLIKNGTKMPTEPGTYIFELEENKAPEGYEGLKEPARYEITLQNSGENLIITDAKMLTGSENVQILTSKKQFISFAVANTTNTGGGDILTNDKPYTVIINKIDEKTREHITDRATFDVALVNGEIVHASTNEQGQMIIENVHMPSKPDEYEIAIKETKSPEGYILDEELKVLKVTFEGVAKDMVISNVESEEGNTNIEIVENECTEDKIVLNVLNKAKDAPLYVVSKKYETGEVIYDLMDSYEGRQYKIDEPFIDTKVSKSGNNVTVEEFIDNLESNGVLTVWDKDGNQIDPRERIKTGMILKATKGEEELTFDIVVKGDIDGDGRVRSKDLDILTKHLSEAEQITDPLGMRAADILDDGKGRVRSNDLDEFYKVLSI